MSEPSPEGYPDGSRKECIDDLGREVPVGPAHPPGRVVSLVPSITELIFGLGAGPRLVGITGFCTEPSAGVAAVEKVGGTKDPDCDRILALRPDLVFLDRDENRIEDFTVLDNAGIPVFVANPHTVRESAATVRRIAASLGLAERAVAIETDIERAVGGGGGSEGRGAVRVFCPIWRNPWMCFNQQIFAGDLVRQAGGELVCDSDQPYRRVTLAEVADERPEVVLLPDEPYVFQARHLGALDQLRDTPAWRNGRIHLVDGKGLFWYGARTPAALRSLSAILAAAHC